MTWSIIARDPGSGAFAMAVATRFFAAGALCLHAESGLGAIATQALVNPNYGPAGLDLLRRGLCAGEVVESLTGADAGRAHRQLHVIDARGNQAAHTGAACIDWCGHQIDEGFSVAGNMLAGPAVIEETARVFAAESDLPLPRRLIAALAAGEAAGGDKRGKQSAALRIFSTESYPDLDIRVDDHSDPLSELARLEAVSRERFVPFRRFLPTRAEPAGIFDRAVIEAGIAAATVDEP